MNSHVRASWVASFHTVKCFSVIQQENPQHLTRVVQSFLPNMYQLNKGMNCGAVLPGLEQLIQTCSVTHLHIIDAIILGKVHSGVREMRRMCSSRIDGGFTFANGKISWCPYRGTYLSFSHTAVRWTDSSLADKKNKGVGRSSCA